MFSVSVVSDSVVSNSVTSPNFLSHFLPFPPWTGLSCSTPFSFLMQMCADRYVHIPGFRFYMKVAYNWRRQWHPTPVLLPGKSHGWRSLVGCSPWGRQESDMTEQLHFDFSLLCIGGGNGNPLQCSCLENPMDRGAWWAAVYGVAQSRT